MPQAVPRDRPPRAGIPRTAGASLRQKKDSSGFWILRLGVLVIPAACPPLKSARSKRDDGDDRDKWDHLFLGLFALFLQHLANPEGAPNLRHRKRVKFLHTLPEPPRKLSMDGIEPNRRSRRAPLPAELFLRLT